MFNFIRKMFEKRATAVCGGHPSDPILAMMFGGGGHTASGQWVNAESSMQVSTVFACIRILCSPLSCLPLSLYERLADGGRRIAREHPLHTLLHDKWNPEQTSLEAREYLFRSLFLHGNAFAKIENAGIRGVDALIPLSPQSVRAYRTSSGILKYDYMPDVGPMQTYRALDREILHLRAFSKDAINGRSVLEFARESIGMAAGSTEYNAKFFGANAVPRSILTAPNAMDDDQFALFQKRYQESVKAGGTAILTDGVKLEPLGLTAKDSQWIEGCQFSIEEVSRFFGVPLHMLSSNARESSFGTGIEVLGIAFVAHTLMFWAKLLEEAIWRDLLTREKGEQERYFAEFNFSALLRGDLNSRYDSYTKGRAGGWLSVNEIRALENLNPIEGGDEYVQAPAVPAPMIAAPKEKQQPTYMPLKKVKG